MNLEQIFEKVKLHDKKCARNWNLNSLEDFILSFEKNSQAANEGLAKEYGNIIKDLVAQIQLKDAILLDDDDREQEVLEEIMCNNILMEKFSKLYTLILRTNKQKEKING